MESPSPRCVEDQDPQRAFRTASGAHGAGSSRRPARHRGRYFEPEVAEARMRSGIQLQVLDLPAHDGELRREFGNTQGTSSVISRSAC